MLPRSADLGPLEVRAGQRRLKQVFSGLPIAGNELCKGQQRTLKSLTPAVKSDATPVSAG